MNKPENIKNDMLSPIDNIYISIMFSLFNFMAYRIIAPDTKYKRINPRNCRNIGTFRWMAKSVRIIIVNINIRRLFLI